MGLLRRTAFPGYLRVSTGKTRNFYKEDYKHANHRSRSRYADPNPER